MIIPVFDVKGNQCVSGKSGKRDTYTRLESVYGDDILDIARNLKMSGAKSVYIADLDKIEGCGDNSSLISQVNDIIPVLLDNGANCVDDIVFNKNICTYSILASESMTNLNDIRNIFEELPYEKLIISVDIKDNELLVEDKDIKFSDVISLINDVKPDYSILLNISQVGTEKGNNDSTVKNLIDNTPYTQHVIAGGVTNESIREYRSAGIDNFLIGTILHEGNLSDEFNW